MAITIFRQRSTAEAEHQDVLRLMREQKKAHHLLRIRKLQRGRIAYTHFTLRERARKIQRTRIAVFDNEGFVVAATKNLVNDCLTIAIIGFEQTDHASFTEEGIAQFDHWGGEVGKGLTRYNHLIP